MDLPSRKSLPQLGTKSSDVDKLDQRYENEKEAAIQKATQLREQMEEAGLTDRH